MSCKHEPRELQLQLLTSSKERLSPWTRKSTLGMEPAGHVPMGIGALAPSNALPDTADGSRMPLSKERRRIGDEQY